MDLWGRLSRPAQRRLTEAELDDLAIRHESGSTIETLAREFGIAANLRITPSTLTRELQLGGITIRRRGSPPSD